MKEPVQILVFEKHIIKFYDETDYTFGSSDNNKTYDKTFTSGESVGFPFLVQFKNIHNLSTLIMFLTLLGLSVA
jgi:hypothetical protein